MRSLDESLNLRITARVLWEPSYDRRKGKNRHVTLKRQHAPRKIIVRGMQKKLPANV